MWRIKCKFFMKSGNIVTMYCSTFEMTKLTNSRESSKSTRELEMVKNLLEAWSIDLYEIEAFTAKKVLTLGFR